MNLEEQLTAEQFYNNFVADDRFVKYILGGLKTTLLVTLFAVLLGIFLGFLVGTVRSTYERTGKLGVLNVFCRAYLSVIRGTPVTVQLMITYYLIFSSPDSSKLLCAILAFGINSGAYVAEIFRAGILAVDSGQTEAARSLGLSQWQAMKLVVLPQAVKNVLPALANEVVTMVKESSVCSAYGMGELMFAAKNVSGTTLISVGPFVFIALIYFCINFPASKAIEAIERRMRRGDKR